MGPWSGRALLMTVSLGVVACGEPPPPAPSAVIRACPSAVCFGDDSLTSIHLDATRSAPRLTLVEAPVDPNEPPLKLQWSFNVSELVWDIGNSKAPDIGVSWEGKQPLHVTLRVENSVGGVAEALDTIAITPLDENGECPLTKPRQVGCSKNKPCGEGYTCVKGYCQEDSEDCNAIGVAIP